MLEPKELVKSESVVEPNDATEFHLVESTDLKLRSLLLPPLMLAMTEETQQKN